MINPPAFRIFGLDLFRSIAILLVVLIHSDFLLSSNFPQFPYVPLPDGVDLFFVLSGFLVGTILISAIEKKQKLDTGTLFWFLKRRWFRTLPNYFLFLLINIGLVSIGLVKGTLNKYLITYLVFFQNFHKPYDFLFWESWSLSVEEWFYLLFPIFIFVLLKFKFFSLRKSILLVIMSFIIVPFLYRLYLSGNGLNFDLYFRKLVLTRIDTIGYGLLGAYIYVYYTAFWTNYKNYFFVAGIFMLITLLLVDISRIPYYESFYFSVLGGSILFLLPKLEGMRNGYVFHKPIELFSKISYSMYLIHIPLLQLFALNTANVGALTMFLVYILFWLLLILVSFLCYRFFEKPFMNFSNTSGITFLH